MLLINQQKLEVSAAENDKLHPLHEHAEFYLKSTEYLRKTYGKYMRFIDVNQPRYTGGADARGNDIPRMKEPDTIVQIPLQTYYTDEKRGKELWACCLSNPVVLPNNQWDIGRTRSMAIKGEKIVDLNTDMDLAFYLAFISKFVAKRRLRIDNPAEDARAEADREREDTKRQMAIWNMMEEDKLRTMAQAYGVPDVNTKTSDRIRIELKQVLVTNDKLKKSNPAIRGTDDFLDELKVTDGLLLRAFVQNAIDSKQLEFKGDGKWHIGDKVVMHVSFNDMQTKRQFDALCNYLGAPNNNDKLVDFFGDLVNKEYLEGVKDTKVFEWLAKSVGIKVAFKKKAELRKLVLEHFCGGDASGAEASE